MFDALKKRLARDGKVAFAVKVRASAPRSQAKDVLADGTIKIDVAAARENGKANEELIRFLAEEFEVSRQAVNIVKGHMSALKNIAIFD